MIGEPSGPGAPAAFETARFRSTDGVLLHEISLVPGAARGAALIVHGYGEHGERYAPLMRVLSRSSIAARAFDFRGHGRASGRRGHVAHFDEYVSDLESASARAISAHPGTPYVIIAHSHGALVALAWLTSRRRPKELAGLVLTGAYLELAHAPSALQRLQASLFGRLWPTLAVKNPLRVEQLTRDPVAQEEIRADPLRHGVVTPGWFRQSRQAQRALPARWAEVELPLLVVHGAADTVADPAAARRFFDAASAGDKRWVLLEDGRHEVFFDLDGDRTTRLVTDWVLEHVGREPSGTASAAPASPG